MRKYRVSKAYTITETDFVRKELRDGPSETRRVRFIGTILESHIGNGKKYLTSIKY